MFIFFLQRTCYLSINPLKEESVDTEKVQYTLPDGNIVEVNFVSARWNVDKEKSKCTLPSRNIVLIMLLLEILLEKTTTNNLFPLKNK